MTGVIIAMGATDFDLNFVAGILLFCLGLGFFLFPIGIGFYTLGPVARKKRAGVEDLEEPLPPEI